LQIEKLQKAVKISVGVLQIDQNDPEFRIETNITGFSGVEMKIYVRSDLDTSQITEKLTSYFGDEVDEMIKCQKKLQEKIKKDFRWKINSGDYVSYD
jgi:hypothetical protein